MDDDPEFEVAEQSVEHVYTDSILERNDIIWRDWFFNKIDKILDTNNSQPASANNSNNPTIKNVTVLFGHAGSGKTFLMSLLNQMPRFKPQMFMTFYCKLSSTTSSDFVREFEDRLSQVFSVTSGQSSLPNLNVKFRENLLKALNCLGADPDLVAKYQLNTKRYLLVIDSIDLRPDICDLISSNLKFLPQWLHVIITARPKRYKGITKMFSGARKIVIDDIKKTNVYNDLISYINKRKTSELITKKLSDIIIFKSNGSLLFICIILDCFNILDTSSDLKNVGATLNGLYFALFQKFVEKFPKFESEFKLILSAMVPANNFCISMSDFVAKLSGHDKLYTIELLESMEQFRMIHRMNGDEVGLYHSSLYEWLSDVKHCTNKFQCHDIVESKAAAETNLIDTQYTNDNDESINDDDLMLEKAEQIEHLASYGECSQQREQPQQHRPILLKPEPISNGESSSSAKENATNINSLQQQHAPKQTLQPNDDDCLVDSEDDHFEEQCLLSKQDISKEYLDKLYQKFENALHLFDVKALRNILGRYSTVLINQTFIDGKTPLYWAIKKGNIKLMELLIEHEADVNAVCDPEWGYTPLILALMQHSYDLCELLLESDADVEQLDSHSMPPLLHAVFVNCSSDIIKLLLYWGAHTDYIDSTGRSLLHFAAYDAKMWPETINLLLTVGCDEMHRDNNGKTALHMAASNGSLETVDILIEFGGDKLIHTSDKSGTLPLHEAVLKNNVPVCEALITSKSINALAHNGNSPLRIAILFHYLELAQLLILKGADINYKDADGRSIIYCVVAFTHSTIEQKGPPFFNVITFFRTNIEEYIDTAVETIEFLVRFGIDLESQDLEGRTALHVAAWQGTYQIVECLIKLGANINAVDNEGRAPLHMCAWNGHIEVVRLLIESGANVNHVSSTQGATPLLVAAQQGHLATCSLLLSVGSDVLHRDLYGRNACDVAINCGHTEIVKLLDECLVDSKHSKTDAMMNMMAEPNANINLKLSKYDPRFYFLNNNGGANNPNCNSVPNKKEQGGGPSSNKSKKTRSISKLTKMLH